MDRLSPPLEPRLPGILWAVDPAALEDESRHEAAELTQTLEGKANGFKARLLVPVVQPKLESKLTEDLERLRELLS